MTSPILSLISAEQIADNYARGLWRKQTIYQVAAGHSERIPTRYAIRDRVRRLTWRELVAAADRLAGALLPLKLKRGQRVTFWMPDRIESVVTLLACSRLGLVCSPSPHRNHTVAEVGRMIERMRAAVFIHQDGFGADASQRNIMADIEDLGHVVRTMRLRPLGQDDAERMPFEGLIDAASGQSMPAPVYEPDRVSYIAFTSGSTGVPKGVMHSDNTLLVTARAICRDWRIDEDSVVCSMSPFSHNLGIGALMTALMAGAEFVCHDLPRGESLVDRLIETDTDYLIGVPTHAIDLVAEARRRGLQRIGRLRAFRVSGAASPPHVMQALMELGVEPQSGYGMTENNSHQYTRPGDGADLITGSVGRAVDGYEIRIFDPDDPDTALPQGEIGIVGGRGACLMLGYFNDQYANEASFNADGWFMTGDLGRLDPRGYLTITGRKKEVIIRGGHNINPARIEEIAAAFPALDRVAVVALPDDRLGERICLALSLKNNAQAGAGLELEALLEHLSARGLSRYEMPEFLLTLEHMPLMANGKIQKADIMTWIRDGKATPLEIKGHAAAPKAER
jgi:acyl-CoA synthetase